MTFSKGDLVRFPGEDRHVKVVSVDESGPSVTAFVEADEPGLVRPVTLTTWELSQVEVMSADGQAPSADVLGGLWAEWMGSAVESTSGAAMVSSQLTPHPHQHQAVYQRMLPQPMLRFLLGDEPGTGKTIMAGMYAREAQRLGIVSRCLVACPAHLVSKWKEDFDRFFGGGLRRIDSTTVQRGGLRDGLAAGHGFWVVSLELAGVNSAVLDAIQAEVCGWDLVIFDEAHRMTPTAETLHSVGRTLSAGAPRVVMLTATPHRGDEWLFRSLMHLLDPEVFPAPDKDVEHSHRLRPGPMHFLRRMKEELRDHDDEPLFHDRFAYNVEVPLSSDEYPFYRDALELVSRFFPDEAKSLARMVYGKRAASCLYALAETLRRRADHMGTKSDPEARSHEEFGDPHGDDPAAADHARVIFASSTAAREERAAIRDLLGRVDAHLHDPSHSGPGDVATKWPRMVDECLAPHGIEPGAGEQAVVFSEYADTADWLVEQFRREGFTAERYSGRDDHTHRDVVRSRFMAGDFEVIVSTDAGNEGIDLQSAHVLVNWDIPWSLVTLEQRMGRIHRVGQHRDVHLYNLITTGTLEGDTYAKLLQRLVSAANEMRGKMFDCLSLVGEQMFGGDATVPLARMYQGGLSEERARAAIDAITEEQLRQAAAAEIEREKVLAEGVRMDEAIRALQDEQLEQINPYIVERYLLRMESVGLLSVVPSPLHDEGLFNVEGADGFVLPPALLSEARDTTTLVATSADAKTAAVKGGYHVASRAIDLSPATDAFRQLVDATEERLRPALFRGGTVRDDTTTTDYTLFVFETPVVEGPRRTLWRQLIRVDDVGARAVRFDILNNLVATDGTAEGGYHPADAHRAAEAAADAVADRQKQREEALDQWYQEASKRLKRLPEDLVKGVGDTDERTQIRERVRKAASVRANALRKASDLHVEQPTLVGWCRVVGRGAPEKPTEKDSETVAMVHVRKVLQQAGWDVSDVSQENVGYDLRARRGLLHRCIEVKGVWGSAASEGVRLTGGEVIRAGILGGDYWLYVVDRCHDGEGTLAAVVCDPAREFDGLTRDVPVVRISGSDLMAAEQSDPT